MDKLTITIVGRSGCGKGTQAKLIVKRLKSQGVRRLETGRFLRKILRKDNFTTQTARQVMAQGDIFPSWFAAFTWLKEIIEKGAADRHIVFDGSPRKVWEAGLLDEVVSWHDRPLPLCIYIDLSREESAQRLMKRKRADDNPQAIHNRLDFFETDVLPVIDFYHERDRLLTVNGAQSIHKVWKEIDQKLKEKLGERWPAT